MSILSTLTVAHLLLATFVGSTPALWPSERRTPDIDEIRAIDEELDAVAATTKYLFSL